MTDLQPFEIWLKRRTRTEQAEFTQFLEMIMSCTDSGFTMGLKVNVKGGQISFDADKASYTTLKKLMIKGA